MSTCGTRHPLSAGRLTVGDYRCDGGAPSAGVFPDFRLIFVRRGVFHISLDNERLLMSPAHALLVPARAAYRIEHPLNDGDDCTVFHFEPDGWEEVAGSLRGATRRLLASPRAFLAQQHLLRVAQRAAEEDAWNLVATFADEADSAEPVDRSTRVRRAVTSAAELLAARYDQSLPLGVVAGHAGLSRAHLSRAFRDLMGMTMHRYQLAIRLRVAVGRLTDGATDLTALALDLGFVDHSHFTNAFRREFGVAPSGYRRRIHEPSRPLPAVANCSPDPRAILRPLQKMNRRSAR